MNDREYSSSTKESSTPGRAEEFDLDTALEHIAHWLPIQGPLKDFVHHDTLPAVQHLSFHEGVAIAVSIFGARSDLAQEQNQDSYRKYRIKDFAIDGALEHATCPPSQRQRLRDSLFEPDACGQYPPLSLANHEIRGACLYQIDVDLNSLAHPVVFRLLVIFLGQGISRWGLPKNSECFWNCVLRLAQNSLLPPYLLHETGVRELVSADPAEVIGACLETIAGDSKYFQQNPLEMLLAHPDWADMVRIIEQNPRVLLAQGQISLKQMIALKLAVELAFLLKKKGLDFPRVADMPPANAIPLLTDGIKKVKFPLNLRVWHEAMEWSPYSELLAALTSQPAAAPMPEAQALFCIDDRKCSLRCYLKEINPAIETYGAAEFFGIDFLYQGRRRCLSGGTMPERYDPQASDQRIEPATGRRTHNHRQGTEGYAFYRPFAGFILKPWGSVTRCAGLDRVSSRAEIAEHQKPQRGRFTPPSASAESIRATRQRRLSAGILHSENGGPYRRAAAQYRFDRQHTLTVFSLQEGNLELLSRTPLRENRRNTQRPKSLGESA